MSRTTRNWLITAGILILIGAMVMTGAMAINQWKLPEAGRKELITETQTIKESFQDISVETDTEDIEFLPAADGVCKVEFTEPEQMGFSAAVNNGVLEIRTFDEGAWYDNLSLFSVGTPRIRIYLTQSSFRELTVKESTGDVYLPSDFSFENVWIGASTGDIECRSSAAGMLQIGLSTGDILVEKVTAGELSISVSTGSIELRDVDCREKTAITVDTGKAVIKNLNCKDFTSDGNTGDLRLVNVLAEGAISVVRSTGDIAIDGCDASELFIKTETGDVSGTLLSEKVFITESDTGRITVPKTVSGGKCEIITDTGDVDISIK